MDQLTLKIRIAAFLTGFYTGNLDREKYKIFYIKLPILDLKNFHKLYKGYTIFEDLILITIGEKNYFFTKEDFELK